VKEKLLLVQRELYELEDRYKKAMMTNAHLDNEKQVLKYDADRLRDAVDDMTEQTTELQRELRDKTRVSAPVMYTGPRPRPVLSIPGPQT